jgi:hypothetical protein
MFQFFIIITKLENKKKLKFYAEIFDLIELFLFYFKLYLKNIKEFKFILIQKLYYFD